MVPGLEGRTARALGGGSAVAKTSAGGSAPVEAAAGSTATIPVGRFNPPEDYAEAVTFPASTRAGSLTGSVIRVDGEPVAST